MTRTFGTAAALAVALAGQAAFAAPLTTSQTVNFAAGTNVSATDTSENGAVVNSPFTPSGTSSFDKFDTSDGVLTRVDIDLNATQTQSLTVTGSGGNGNRNVTGSGGSTSRIVTPAGMRNVTPLSAGPLTCTVNAGNCPRTSGSSQAVSGSYFSIADHLPEFAAEGGGTFDVARTLRATASVDSASFNNPSATYSARWGSGSITTTYSYLTHADGSFAGDADSNSLTLDFGELFQGDAATDRSFSLFNLGDASTAGLDLDSIVGSGDTGAFSNNLATFFGLAAGAAAGPFTVSFNTSALGDFLATYTLGLSDADVGYGMANSQLVLTLTGRVVERPSNPVPEPGAVGLLGLGLLGLASLRRRKAA